MISIITAIHNGIEMNRLFWEYLKKYTHFPFELIVIDNNSTDGSLAFFESTDAKVIKNSDNYSYPVCQNQGIKKAVYDVLVFINNDIIVSPAWDKRLLEAAEANNLDIITPVSLENMGDITLTKKLRRKWLRIRNSLSLFGHNRFTLKLMLSLMYNDWEKYCNCNYELFGTTVAEGIVGHTVMMKRNALAKVGLWDEQIQGADFDLFFRARKRFMETGDIKPVHFAKGVVLHHYIRLTSKKATAPFVDKMNLISVEEKWGNEAFGFYSKFMG